MRVLLDNCVPRGIVAALWRHNVIECRVQGWDQLRNGDLIQAADAAGFQVLVTADQSILHQQNLAQRKIAIVALDSNHWQLIRPHLKRIVAVVENAQAGTITEISVSAQ